jgi:RNA polymerase sigma factor (TIGR02999 family)
MSKAGALNEVTHILEAAQNGNPGAAEELSPLVYRELRKLAAQQMAREAPGHTLQPTALVHEAWLRMLKSEERARFENRAYFFAAAAEAMRRILVESARRKQRVKHGGHLERMDTDIEVALPMPEEELLILDEALQRLTEAHVRAAEVVKLCFFVGFTQVQAAKELGLSICTVEREWSFARAWLFEEMKIIREGESRED